uniref:FAM86 N-terminal domain-containing protein n=1 Tax=Electrophorus electricus TaxID=8005 RepID=A0A4W4H290_ELEEL
MPHSRLRCLHDKNGTNSHDVPSNFQLLFFAMCRMSSKASLTTIQISLQLSGLPSGEPVGLEENVAVISEGTTGLVTWEAALHLAEWALEHPDIFTGRTVLELGSGVGLTGIVVCRVCKPTKYVFSDCHQSVLERLRNNITRNGLTEQGSPGVSVLTEEVDWQNVKKDQLRRIGADTIIAADVVYDPDIIGCLVRLLAELLKCKGQQRHPEVYIASTIRNPETYNCFKNELGEFNAGLKHIVITHPVTQVFPYNRIVSIEMIKVHC